MTWQTPPYWHENFRRVQEACRRSGGTHDAPALLRQLNEDNTAFWLATPDSFGMAEIWTYPCKRVINWSFAGGRLDEILSFGERFKGLAKAAGCSEVQLTGRPGWERVLRDYRKTGVVLRQYLEG